MDLMDAVFLVLCCVAMMVLMGGAMVSSPVFIYSERTPAPPQWILEDFFSESVEFC